MCFNMVNVSFKPPQWLFKASFAGHELLSQTVLIIIVSEYYRFTISVASWVQKCHLTTIKISNIGPPQRVPPTTTGGMAQVS